MVYAILDENNIITNITEASYAVEPNWEGVPVGMPVSIGDRFENNAFYSPEGEIRLSPDTLVIADALEALLKGIAEA